jgi:hypothetical protein
VPAVEAAVDGWLGQALSGGAGGLGGTAGSSQLVLGVREPRVPVTELVHTVGRVDIEHTVGRADIEHTVGHADIEHTVGHADIEHTVGHADIEPERPDRVGRTPGSERDRAPHLGMELGR